MKHILLVVSICFFSLTYSQNQAELEKVAYSEYLQSDLELNQIFQEEKRSEEVIIRSKKSDEIHEKYEVEY